MNRTKYRVWLISIVLAAAVFGAVWYFSGKEEEKTITDGTLVYHELTAEELAAGNSEDGELTAEGYAAEGIPYE